MPTLAQSSFRDGPDVWSSLRDASGFRISTVIDFPWPKVDGSCQVACVTFTVYVAGGQSKKFTEVPIILDVENNEYDLRGRKDLAPGFRRDIAREAMGFLSPLLRTRAGLTLEERRSRFAAVEIYGC